MSEEAIVVAPEMEQFQDFLFSGKIPEGQVAQQEQKPAEETPIIADGEVGSKPTEVNPQVIDFDSLLKERTNGKYSSLDEVLNLKPTEQEAIKFADDEAKSLFDAFQKKEYDKLYNYLDNKITLSKIAEMPADAAIKLMYKKKYPDLTSREIELQFSENYGIDESLDPEIDAPQIEKQKERTALKLKIDSRDAKAYLESLNKEIVLPDIQQPELDWMEVIPKEVADHLAKVNDFSEQFTEALSKSANLDKISFTFKDNGVNGAEGNTYFQNDYTVTADENKALNEKASNYWEYISSRYANGGKYDAQALKRDIYILENYEKIVQAQVKKALGDAKDGLLKEIKNIKDPVRNGQPVSVTGNEAFDRIYPG